MDFINVQELIEARKETSIKKGSNFVAASEELLNEDKLKKQINEIAKELNKSLKENNIDLSKIDGPKHYGGYQVLELIFDSGFGEGFCLGNVLKYIARSKKKENMEEDLRKAKIYLDYYLEHTHGKTS